MNISEQIKIQNRIKTSLEGCETLKMERERLDNLWLTLRNMDKINSKESNIVEDAIDKNMASFTSEAICLSKLLKKEVGDTMDIINDYLAGEIGKREVLKLRRDLDVI